MARSRRNHSDQQWPTVHLEGHRDVLREVRGPGQLREGDRQVTRAGSRKTGWRDWARTQGTVEVDPVLRRKAVLPAPSSLVPLHGNRRHVSRGDGRGHGLNALRGGAGDTAPPRTSASGGPTRIATRRSDSASRLCAPGRIRRRSRSRSRSRTRGRSRTPSRSWATSPSSQWPPTLRHQ